MHASRHARARVHVRSGLAPPAARPTDGHFSYRAHARREGGRPRLVLLALLLGPADFGRRRLRMQADMRARVHVRSGLAPPAARPTDGHFSYRAHARREGGRPRLVLLALLLGPADFGRRRLCMQADMRARVHVRSGLAPPAARPTDGHFSYRAHARREGGRPRLVLLALLLGPADFGRRRLRMQADMRARVHVRSGLTPPAARPTDGHFSYRAHARREGGRPRLVLLALLLGPADFGRRRLRMQADMRARVHCSRLYPAGGKSLRADLV